VQPRVKLRGLCGELPYLLALCASVLLRFCAAEGEPRCPLSSVILHTSLIAFPYHCPMTLRICLIRERKEPADRRVAMTPKQLAAAAKRFPNARFFIEPSSERIFRDEEYTRLGIELMYNPADADVLIGVKEVPESWLIPHKTYLFFSHTIKMQPYNQQMFRDVLHKRIRLIDYECLTWNNGERILGFGQWAGIVGAYNALLTWGRRTGQYQLKPAWKCPDYRQLLRELSGIRLPPLRIVSTGSGRVAGGSIELLESAGIRQVSPEDYLYQDFDFPVFTALGNEHLYARKDGMPFNREHFFKNHSVYHCTFQPYIPKTDVLIQGIYWETDMEAMFSKEDTRHPDFRIKVIADISCDVEGSVPITLKATTPDNPTYGWYPELQNIGAPFQPESIDIMAVTNLPTELPADASDTFGNYMLQHVIPLLLEGDRDNILERATLSLPDGTLNPLFSYLSEYAGVSQ
jgi:saccharopine dehydrogenase (NAD+, L-lysine-forming)